VCFCGLMNLGTEKPGITSPLFPILYTLCPHKGITSGEGRCCSHREIASFKVKGSFLDAGSAMRLRQFCIHHKEHFLRSKLWVLDREFFGTGDKCHPSSTLNKLTREHGGEKPCSDQISCQDHVTQMAGDWRGGCLEGVLTHSDQ
jgi:hypothetical protein